MTDFVGVDQKPDGCWIACIASLTGIALGDFPDVPHDSPTFDQPTMRNKVTAVLRERGWQLHHLWTHPEAVPQGWAIAGGESPRGVAHAIVVYDGGPVWDPHPSRAGLTTVEDYEILVPVRAGNALPAKPGTENEVQRLTKELEDSQDEVWRLHEGCCVAEDLLVRHYSGQRPLPKEAAHTYVYKAWDALRNALSGSSRGVPEGRAE